MLGSHSASRTASKYAETSGTVLADIQQKGASSTNSLLPEKNRTEMKRNPVIQDQPVVLDATIPLESICDGTNYTGAHNFGDNHSLSYPSSSDYLHNKEAPKFTPPENWANAPEFVPKSSSLPCTIKADQSSDITGPIDVLPPRTYAAVVGVGETSPQKTGENIEDMCPYAMVGECRYGEQCLLLHGNMCDLCGQCCLHPYDPVQREIHTKECIRQHEQNMELSFAVARSSDKSCGICMEVVMEKSPPGEQRFGILPACNHCYCLSCLRKWRQARQFENKICRSCPECRVTSDFICPSRFWVESKEEKDKLISSYKTALSKKPCRYYKNGNGECPFGNKCFYLHSLPNGTKVDVGPPRRKPKKVQMDGQEVTAAPGSSIWDFLYDWELQWLDVEDFMDIFSSDFEDESDEEDDLHDFPPFYL